jgi:hypothetical protein
MNADSEKIKTIYHRGHEGTQRKGLKIGEAKYVGRRDGFMIAR